MPSFSFEVPDKDSGPRLHLRRTPANGSLTAIVTCHRMIGCPTHWYGHRTIPCEPPDCPACKEGHSWRWHGYLTALNVNTNEHFLFEMTAQAADPFTKYFENHHTLRGCLFVAERLAHHHNGRVLIRYKTADLAQVKLPDPPDLIACICHIWNVPIPEASLDGQLKQVDRIRLNPKPNGNNEPVHILAPKT